jgi:hypothetical protein
MLKSLSVLAISLFSFSVLAGVEVGNGIRSEGGVEVGSGVNSDDGVEIGNGITQLTSSNYDYLNCNEVENIRKRKILALTKITIADTVNLSLSAILNARPLKTYAASSYHKRQIRLKLVSILQTEFGETANVDVLIDPNMNIAWDQPDFLVRDLYNLVLTSFEQNCLQL